MKKLLSMTLVLLAAFAIHAQNIQLLPEKNAAHGEEVSKGNSAARDGNGTVTIGNMETLMQTPYDFYFHYSISQTIYYPSEIGLDNAVFTAIEYYNNFNEALWGKDIMIWMAETDAPSLSGGWIDFSEFQLVFDGQVDFPRDDNPIYIPLDFPYSYEGGNLVIYSYKPDNEWSFFKDFFNTVGSGARSRVDARDNDPYDVSNPGVSGSVLSSFPDITIYYSQEQFGTLAGTVTNGSQPLEGVEVKIAGTQISTLTDENGAYEIGALLPDTYSVLFTKQGYHPEVAEEVIITAGVETTLNMVMTAIPVFNLSGTVEGNDGFALAGAQISLGGTYEYETVADAAGVFLLDEVFEGTYVFSVKMPGYESHIVNDFLVDQDMNLDIVLTEIIAAPFGLLVETEGLEPGDAFFSWNNVFGWQEAFYEGVMPDGWTQIITNHGSQAGFPSTWHITGTVPLSTPVVPKEGDYQAFMMWNANHQDEWLITHEFTVPPGDLVFWYHGANGSTHGDNYYVKISTDGGNSWTILWNASDLPAGNNYYYAPAIIDLSDYLDQNVHLAWHNVDGPNNDGLWHAWAIDNISVGAEKIDVRGLQIVSSPQSGLNQAARDGAFARPVAIEDMNYQRSKILEGYNVFLDGVELASGLTEASFLFSGLLAGQYTAGVQSVYTTGTSEIVTLDFVVENGIPLYNVSFTVHDADNNPVDDAVITLDGTTNDPGDYLFADIGPGNYEYSVEKTGYETVTGMVEVSADTTVDVVMTIVVSVVERVNDNLTIYPNPAHGSLFIESEQEITSIRMIDILGQLVYYREVDGLFCEINVGGLKNGIYFVQVYTAGGVATQRVQVNSFNK